MKPIKSIADAPLRGKPKAGQRITEHVADCTSKETNHRAKGITKEHRNRDGRAQRHLADGRHNKDSTVEQPGKHSIQCCANRHPYHLTGAHFPGVIFFVA